MAPLPPDGSGTKKKAGGKPVLSATGFEIDGFDAKAMCTSKELTAFEFLFGLGKSWAEKFPCLKFASKNEDDEVN